MRIIAVSLVIISVFCVVKDFSEDVRAAEKKPIKIAVNTWPGNIHVFLAREKEFFRKNNVDVELVHIIEHIDSQELFLNGDVDGIFQCLTDTIIQNAQISSKVVYMIDYSSTGDVIIGNVDTLSDLKGKTVAIEGVNSFSHIFVLNALENAGLSEHEINFKIVPAHHILEALDKSIIDAGHTWEPTKSDAIEKGYNVLGSAGDNLGIISDILVFRSKIIEERPEDILAIVKSLVEAQVYRDANWTESIKIMAKAVNISYEDMESGVLGTRQLDLQGNIKAMKESDDPLSLYVSGRYIVDFYMKRGQLPKVTDLDEIIYPVFVNQLDRE